MSLIGRGDGFFGAVVKLPRGGLDTGDMRTVPRNPTDRILFYQIHATRWAENAAHIGVSEAQVAELETAVADAKAAMLRQHQARDAARSATLGLKSAMEKLSNIGSTLMLQIRAKAASAGGAVYSLAWVPAPNKPSPIEQPGRPTNFQATLLGMGWVEVSWTCKNPRGSQGTMYEVERQVRDASGTSAFRFLGTVGTKKFIDHSIPQGAIDVTYRVRAIRSKKRGPVGTHIIEFGNHASPGMVSQDRTLNGTPFLAAA